MGFNIYGREFVVKWGFVLCFSFLFWGNVGVYGFILLELYGKV